MNPIRKAETKPTRVNAIRAYCYDCMGGTDQPKTERTIVGYVRECTAVACPLWTHRPWRSREQKAADRETASTSRPIPDEAPVRTAFQYPWSKPRAIRARCWECQGGTADSGVKDRIRDCACADCPLYPVRPYRDPVAGNCKGVEKVSLAT